MEASSSDARIDGQINECIELLRRILKDDLLGCYLYGSFVAGGLGRYSDVDIFVVAKRPTTLAEKETWEKSLMSISGIYGSTEKRPIEMTIVVQSDIDPWHYPPRFDFQYGDWLREAFASGSVEPWITKTKPDLAIVITQVLLTGKTLYGQDAEKLLPAVPYNDFMTALTYEMDTVHADLDWDTRNVLLTLARMWSTAETDTIRSKQQAAEWVIERLSAEYKPIMERALAIAAGKREDTWTDLGSLPTECADVMVGKIQEQMKVIQSRDNIGRKISITA